MVSTRSHPRTFPPPDVSPAKSASSAKSASPPPASSSSAMAAPAPPSTRKRTSTTGKKKSPSSSSSGGWAHAPSNLVLAWLWFSLPLVIYDFTYVLLRPHTLEGGKFHAPIWSGYAWYGKVDMLYGWPAWEENNGFQGAQGIMNVVETLMYLVYLYVVQQHGKSDHRVPGRGAPATALGWFSKARVVGGQAAGFAVILGFTTATITMSKTVIYWLQEACTGFKFIGHNDAGSLALWAVMNGVWIIFPAYIMYVFGAEILDGLAAATGAESPAPRVKGE